MPARHILKRATLALGLVLAAAGGAVSQERAAPERRAGAPGAPRTFDYWQPDWMIRELWGPGHVPKGLMARLLRHTIYTQYGVPKEYEGARSTVPASPEAIAAGAKAYAEQCARCHGSDGMGNGDTGLAVNPSPALLAYMIRRPISVDEYLLWAISDGGQQINSEMPAFKDKLARDDIWRIIAFMRAGFPEGGPGEGKR